VQIDVVKHKAMRVSIKRTNQHNLEITWVEHPLKLLGKTYDTVPGHLSFFLWSHLPLKHGGAWEPVA
jgi:hypothetical protein